MGTIRDSDNLNERRPCVTSNPISNLIFFFFTWFKLLIDAYTLYVVKIVFHSIFILVV